MTGLCAKDRLRLREGEPCGVKAILAVMAETQDALCHWLPNQFQFYFFCMDTPLPSGPPADNATQRVGSRFAKESAKLSRDGRNANLART